MDIYVWNALVSGAFFSSLHICEVVMRNGVAHALELKYGHDWPWNSGFERTLTAARKADLQQARQGIPVGSTGKVIAELKFVFWCKMFTVRHDPHVWNVHLRTAFPFLPFPLTVAAARTMLYDENHMRIARLIKSRCGETAEWLTQWEVVTAALAAKP